MKKLFTALAAATLALGLGIGTAEATAPAAAPQAAAYNCGWYYGTELTVRGHSGDRVREVQCLLEHWGFNVGPTGVDGKFGTNTEGAVRQFQGWYGGLAVDGKVGVNTWAALRS
ncbi:peptidoglycan-binding protein [Streptomyces sp. NBC_00237]|uniref:peptidoglycan-binding domain-containing protein n=1 Tax=Streptomyces sp. NBC_00237 TaxID=2975687 RepID=UPI002256D85E|nr:peptidoglycan-binding domain-containing protein [Streptomyces sp. NBC_00237]MCX5204393.1 peptidoglycan-binding protein [Streptomyces sp. NBC_00237]